MNAVHNLFWTGDFFDTKINIFLIIQAKEKNNFKTKKKASEFDKCPYIFGNFISFFLLFRMIFKIPFSGENVFFFVTKIFPMIKSFTEGRNCSPKIV